MADKETGLTIRETTPENLPEVEKFLAGLGAHPTDWDRSLDAAAHARIEVIAMEKALAAGGKALVAESDSGVLGVALVAPSEWNTRYFGVLMGEVACFRIGPPAAARPLAARIDEIAGAMGLKHVSFIADTGDRETLLAFQSLGWKAVWAVMRMACPMRTVDVSTFTLNRGSLEMREFQPDDLDPLLEIASRIPEFSWLAFEDALPADKRRGYKVELPRSCAEKKFADIALTLLDGGRPIGMYASSFRRHPEGIGSTRYAEDKLFFLDPLVRERGVSKFLTTASFKTVYERGIEYVTTRIRLHAPAMLHLAMSVGFRLMRGEVYLVKG